MRRLYRPDPARTFIVGVSEGGLVATLAAERHPERSTARWRPAARSATSQAARLLRRLPGGVRLPLPRCDPRQRRWTFRDSVAPTGTTSMRRRSWRRSGDHPLRPELVGVTGAPVASARYSFGGRDSVGVLWYDVFGSADAHARLGGQPFDNVGRVYSGSSDDAALNAGVHGSRPTPPARGTGPVRDHRQPHGAPRYIAHHG